MKTVKHATKKLRKYGGYINYTDIALQEEIFMNMYAYNDDEVAQEVVDQIEYLNHHEPALLEEWVHRIINHYNLHTCIRDDTLMQYLYHDWNEATVNWFKYDDLVGSMLQLYIDEITDQLQDQWEQNQIPN